MKKIALSLLTLIMIFSLVSCFGSIEATGAWENATYRRDTTVGKGASTVTLEVVAEEKTVTLTVKTDEKMLGAALLKEGIIAGEDGPYGLYIKTVNGILADYDVDKTYWAFYVDGEYALVGVDSTAIEAGKVYRLSKDKG
jgi:hypothetical protein